MNRRQFLKLTANAALSALALNATGAYLPVFQSKVWGASSSQKIMTPGRDEKLVVVFLRGALDGLSTLIPYGDRDYYRLRPSIAISMPGEKDGVIPLDNTFGMHPSLKRLLPYWEKGQMSFVRSFGSLHPTRSHFEAQDFMETGFTGADLLDSGWMNRLAGVLPQSETSKFSMNFGNTTPRIFSGDQSISSYSLGKNSEKPLPIDDPVVQEAFNQLYSGEDVLSQSYQEGLSVRTSLKKALSQEQIRANNGAPLPAGFSETGAKIGKLLRVEPSIHLAFTDIGGWDTHANQGNGVGQLARNINNLSLGLQAMIEQMQPETFKKTTILVFSEFGRTAKENGNKGTDHGHGSMLMILGGGIRGHNIYGDWLGLQKSELYQGRDLPVLHDFRSVLGGLLASKYKLSPAQLGRVFPDMPASYQQFSSLL